MHDMVVTLVAYGLEAFTGATAHDPYIIAAFYVADHGSDDPLRHGFKFEDPVHVNIVFCMVGKYERHVGPVPDQPGNDVGCGGTMGMDQIRLEIDQPGNGFFIKRISSRFHSDYYYAKNHRISQGEIVKPGKCLVLQKKRNLLKQMPNHYQDI
jgi:hypothetical protein